MQKILFSMVKCFLTLTLLIGLMTNALHGQSSQQPNIIFIFADDLGYSDLASYGHPYAVTPNLDRMAAEGTSFMQHYVTGVTCNPSRTGLMTSYHPARYQKYAANYGFQDRISITEILNNSGYLVGHFGKWHIGPKNAAKDGIYGIDSVNVIGGDHKDVEGRDAMMFREADKFIREHVNDQPFYINIWAHSTHFPVHVAPELASKFVEVKVRRSDFSDSMQKKFDECLEIGGDLDDSMIQYLADVYSLDFNVGRILDTLDELGIADNTIVVFSSDHGPAPVILGKGHREYSNNMLGYAGIFRGAKHNQLEGGIRVPFIIRWPGKVPAGRVDTESVTSFIDWMPTLSAITGAEGVPEDIDGEDISEIWFGESRPRETPLFWKASSTGSTPSMRYKDWKLHMPRKNRGDPELYNLAEDPAESNNLAESEPEVFAAMTKMLAEWNDQLPKSYDKAGRR